MPRTEKKTPDAKRPRPVSYRAASNLMMVAGNENKHSTVILKGVVKQWVGIGWVDRRKATKQDYLTYPEVK